MNRFRLETVADQRAEGLGGPARLATWGAIAFCVTLPLIELWLWTSSATPDAAIAWAATALFLPLHLRHVAYALRGERAPRAAWSLSAMTVVVVAAALVIGPAWAIMFASLAVSVLLVVPWPWSILLFTAVLASPLAYGLHLEPAWPVGSSGYLAFSIALRSVPLFVVVWLVAATRQLHATRAALSELAVVGERIRIDAELGRTVGTALETIVEECCRAERLVEQPAQAESVVQSVVQRSRETLAHGRRTVGSYQQVTTRSQLDAAITLLAAAGVDARLVVRDQTLLNVTDDTIRSQLGSLVIRLLRDGPSQCTVELDGSPSRPTLRVAVLDPTNPSSKAARL